MCFVLALCAGACGDDATAATDAGAVETDSGGRTDAATGDDASPPRDDGGSGDAAADDAGASPACDPATSRPYPAETWTFAPVEGAVCAMGTPTGIGINPGATPGRVLVYFKGGGACFSAMDCSASDLDGFGEAKLAAQTRGNRLFDRASTSNPFRDYSYVFIPYCTGDFHSGDNLSDYGMHHVGHRNVELYLELLADAFCDAEQVVVTGTSAGGFGATFNYAAAHETFGDIPVDLIDDSGPYMRPAYMPAAIQDLTATNWGWRDNVPSGCADCATSWHALYTHAAATYPDDRISLVSSLRDPSIQGRFGRYGGITSLAEFERGIEDLADAVLAPLPNARVFYTDSMGHVWTTGSLDGVSVGGTTLRTFIEQQVGDDPGWASVRP